MLALIAARAFACPPRKNTRPQFLQQDTIRKNHVSRDASRVVEKVVERIVVERTVVERTVVERVFVERIVAERFVVEKIVVERTVLERMIGIIIGIIAHHIHSCLQPHREQGTNLGEMHAETSAMCWSMWAFEVRVKRSNPSSMK